MKQIAFALVAIACTGMLFTNCSKYDDEDSVTVVGSWTLDGVMPDVVVNTIPLKKFLVDSAGMTETMANAQYTAMMAEMGMDGGTIELKDDGTYVAKFGSDEQDTGTWLLSDDSKMLTVTSSKDNEKNMMTVVSLTETTLVLSMVQTETTDMNDDMVDDDMVVTMTMTFMKK